MPLPLNLSGGNSFTYLARYGNYNMAIYCPNFTKEFDWLKFNPCLA